MIEFFTQSYQPLFYLGGGVIRANAFKIIQQFSKTFQIPVTTTLMGKSCYNEMDHLGLGMLGMHGTAYANFAVSECDLLLAIGARFDDRVTGKLEEFACDAEVIHVDIDPAEISKNRCPQLAIVGDVRKTFLQALKTIRTKNILVDSNQTKSWLKRIYKWKKSYPLIATNYKSATLSPQETISLVGSFNKNAYFTTDVGQHQMWSAQLINCQPKKWISSSGLGTMGFGLPSAIGAKVANPDQNVICISGDSSFQMSIQELATISQYQLAIHMVVVNNGWQGMVRQWQESFYGNRFSNSYMRNGMPNFSAVAEAYSIQGCRVTDISDLTTVIKNPQLANQPLLVEVNVIENENCYPMVAPGRSNSQMLGLEKQTQKQVQV
jgi:acetolactate synthase-1/2/3 large subunit